MCNSAVECGIAVLTQLSRGHRFESGHTLFLTFLPCFLLALLDTSLQARFYNTVVHSFLNLSSLFQIWSRGHHFSAPRAMTSMSWRMAPFGLPFSFLLFSAPSTSLLQHRVINLVLQHHDSTYEYINAICTIPSQGTTSGLVHWRRKSQLFPPKALSRRTHPLQQPAIAEIYQS